MRAYIIIFIDMIQMTIFIMFLLLTTLLVRRNTSIRKADYIIPDCIDIQCEIQPVPFEEISKAEKGEPSSSIRQRVIAARKMQEERYRSIPHIHCNAQMTERMIHEYAAPDEAGITLLKKAMHKLNLSARAYNRILKVARTIADLDASADVKPIHLAEAIAYRSLDRGDWAERPYR